MSALHRLKAYFGMVPAEELDEYGPDYRDDYRDDRRGGYDDDYAEDVPDPAPVRRYRPEPERVPRTRDAFRDDQKFRDDQNFRDDQHAYQPVEPAARTRVTTPPRRPSWAIDAPVRGALAMDTAPPVREPVRESSIREPDDDAHPLGRIVTLHPKTYNEARPIGERYREGTPVIMNLTGMDDADAKRLVDFAAGLAFALRGSIDKVTSKVFLLSPADVDVTAEDRRRLADRDYTTRS